jgi:hypothetical protein
MDTSDTTKTYSAIPRNMNLQASSLASAPFGWDFPLFKGVIIDAQSTLDDIVTRVILLTLIRDLINTYTKSYIIKDLGNLFNNKNTLEKPDKIEKFITSVASADILNITQITHAVRARTCTNREILYCIQMLLLCKKTYTIC